MWIADSQKLLNLETGMGIRVAAFRPLPVAGQSPRQEAFAIQVTGAHGQDLGRFGDFDTSELAAAELANLAGKFKPHVVPERKNV